ncbi:MAG: exopolysaccharide biosynthesis protein [Acidimicrobiia bacterium]|nr:exopolysaccharide biosynthesis protein [Acidimicrobiia bacterium]
MIDIHSHILYGLDDGSKDLEQSVAMVRMAGENGTTDIVATPHSNLEYRFQPELVEARIAELQKAAGPTPRIHYGCDFHLSYDNIQDAVAHPGRYSINHNGYLLVEFSDLTIFHTTTQIFEQLLAAGLAPVITHPERNLLLQQRLEQLKSWAEMGVAIQVTGQSFLGRFGNRAQEFSEALMKERLVHFVASDAHDLKHRTTDLSEVRNHLVDHYGEPAAASLLVGNPRAALDGRPLEPVPEPAPRRKWFSFLR